MSSLTSFHLTDMGWRYEFSFTYYIVHVNFQLILDKVKFTGKIKIRA